MRLDPIHSFFDSKTFAFLTWMMWQRPEVLWVLVDGVKRQRIYNAIGSDAPGVPIRHIVQAILDDAAFQRMRGAWWACSPGWYAFRHVQRLRARVGERCWNAVADALGVA